MKFSVTLLTTLFLASYTWAGPGGDAEGNGGDAVVCVKADGTTTAELLDYFEARTMRGFQIDLGGLELTADQKIELALSRLERFSPHRAKEYREKIARFENEAWRPQGMIFRDIPDSAHITLPEGCTIEQVAIQNEPRFKKDPRYSINQDLWNLMDADSQAGLKLHEVIYSEAVAAGQKNSVSTRYLNSFLATKDAETITFVDFDELIRLAGFKYSEIAGVKLRTYPRLTINKDGSFTGQLFEDTKLTSTNSETIYAGRGREITIESSGKIDLAKNRLASGIPNDDFERYHYLLVKDAKGNYCDFTSEITTNLARSHTIVVFRLFDYWRGTPHYSNCDFRTKIMHGKKTTVSPSVGRLIFFGRDEQLSGSGFLLTVKENLKNAQSATAPIYGYDFVEDKKNSPYKNPPDYLKVLKNQRQITYTISSQWVRALIRFLYIDGDNGKPMIDKLIK